MRTHIAIPKQLIEKIKAEPYEATGAALRLGFENEADLSKLWKTVYALIAAFSVLAVNMILR